MTELDKSIAQAKQARQARIVKLLASAGVLAVVAVAAIWLVPHFSGPAAPPAPATPATAKVPVLGEAGRQQLQQQLNDAEQRLQAIEQNADQAGWQPARLASLQADRDAAFRAYSHSDYAKAQQAVRRLHSDLDGFEQDYTKAYEQAFAAAKAAFVQQDMHNAQAHNHRALAIRSDYAPALALAPRIAAYPKVARLYEAARIAKVENNPDKQIAALTQLLDLDPAQPAARDQLTALQTQRKEAAFSRALAQAINAMEQGRLAQASSLAAEAASLFPQRAELSALRRQIEQAQAAQGLAKTEQQVTTFAQADEWQTVKLLAGKGLAAYPASEVLQNALRNSDRILASHQQLTGYLQRPDRLADANIRQKAVNAISQTHSITHLSPSLQAQVDQLEQAIDKYNAPVPVTVRSDARTHIRVLGVGIVGTVDEKQISLKPGTYQFEGSREGYRSKIVSVEVPAGQTDLVVSLVCDEQV